MKLKALKNNIKKYFKLSKSLYRDKRTPLISRLFLGLAILYFISPIDLILDFIPVVGQLDDIVIVPFLFFIAVKTIPHKIYREHHLRIFNK